MGSMGNLRIFSHILPHGHMLEVLVRMLSQDNFNKYSHDCYQSQENLFVNCPCHSSYGSLKLIITVTAFSACVRRQQTSSKFYDNCGIASESVIYIILFFQNSNQPIIKMSEIGLFNICFIPSLKILNILFRKLVQWHLLPAKTRSSLFHQSSMIYRLSKN